MKTIYPRRDLGPALGPSPSQLGDFYLLIVLPFLPTQFLEHEVVLLLQPVQVHRPLVISNRRNFQLRFGLLAIVCVLVVC